MDRFGDGVRAESEAAIYLESNGYRIIARNVNYPKIGELDIVCECGGTIVFVEVKYRASNKYGYPIEAVTETKASKIVKAANVFIRERRLYEKDVRFDIIVSKDGVIEHIQNAFYGEWR